jgi:hypothetical protein
MATRHPPIHSRLTQRALDGRDSLRHTLWAVRHFCETFGVFSAPEHCPRPPRRSNTHGVGSRVQGFYLSKDRSFYFAV